MVLNYKIRISLKGWGFMWNKTETIILRLSRNDERKIRDKAIKDNKSITEYIKQVCIYNPWIENYEE